MGFDKDTKKPGGLGRARGCASQERQGRMATSTDGASMDHLGTEVKGPQSWLAGSAEAIDTRCQYFARRTAGAARRRWGPRSAAMLSSQRHRLDRL